MSETTKTTIQKDVQKTVSDYPCIGLRGEVLDVQSIGFSEGI
jgi:hypothetical protein